MTLPPWWTLSDLSHETSLLKGPPDAINRDSDVFVFRAQILKYRVQMSNYFLRMTEIMQKSLFLFLIAFVCIPAVSAQDADKVLEDLKSTYESIAAINADFKQTMTSEFMTDPQTAAGTLTLMGDNYRVETGVQTIITDGAVTWVYNSTEDQLIINDYEEDETTFSISDFFFSFDEKYAVRDLSSDLLEGSKHHVLGLTPLDRSSFFTDVTLWVRESDNIITRLQILDANETTMIFELTGIQINPDVSADAFSFTPTENTDVVDLRS